MASATRPRAGACFPQLSVLDNLRVGGITRDAAELPDRIERIYGYFPRLKERASQRAGSLSGGEQQMLAIGRALMSKPSLLMLDEPSLGLAPVIVERIGDILQEVQATEGLAVLLAEQNATWALSLAKRAVILDLGRISMTGDAAALLDDPDVRKAYLGGVRLCAPSPRSFTRAEGRGEGHGDILPTPSKLAAPHPDPSPASLKKNAGRGNCVGASPTAPSA